MPVHHRAIAPLIIADEAVAATASASTVYGANIVYLYAFELQATATISGAKWRVGATATGTTDIGIYDSGGNLLTHTGAVANVASTTQSANFSGGNYTLSPGQYFMALVVSNATDTISGLAVGNPAVMSRMRQATNSGAAGVLPLATGGYSDAPAKFPAFALTVAGGLT